MADNLIIIAGPTASGKSALARLAALEFGGEIVNADSMQVYRELRILTARPSAADEASVPHHLYGVLPAAERCSAARWRAMAIPCIEQIRERGRLPLVVGGSGLYLRALLDGLSPMPDIAPAIRTEVRRLMTENGPEWMHRELGALDPVSAARLDPSDRQRITRAWEVVTATGRPLSSWQGGQPDGGLALARGGAGILKFVLEPPRDWLYRRCDARLGDMVASGGLEELAGLDGLGLDPGLPAMKALGVPQLLDYLHGKADLDTAVAAARTATRRYAKRQLTWFRNQCADWNRITEQDSETKINLFFSFIRKNLLTEQHS